MTARDALRSDGTLRGDERKQRSGGSRPSLKQSSLKRQVINDQVTGRHHCHPSGELYQALARWIHRRLQFVVRRKTYLYAIIKQKSSSPAMP